jgi:hypothetical protein
MSNAHIEKLALELRSEFRKKARRVRDLGHQSSQHAAVRASAAQVYSAFDERRN